MLIVQCLYRFGVISVVSYIRLDCSILSQRWSPLWQKKCPVSTIGRLLNPIRGRPHDDILRTSPKRNKPYQWCWLKTGNLDQRVGYRPYSAVAPYNYFHHLISRCFKVFSHINTEFLLCVSRPIKRKQFRVRIDRFFAPIVYLSSVDINCEILLSFASGAVHITHPIRPAPVEPVDQVRGWVGFLLAAKLWKLKQASTNLKQNVAKCMSLHVHLYLW